jgi:branched-chain amino acid transport system ATP-binding protein
VGSLFQSRSYREEEKRLSQKADEILAFLEIEEKAGIIADDIPSVDQRKLEIAIALAGEPELLLLDEPAAGMNPEEQGRAINTIKSLKQSGITLVVVEHNMKVIMGLCTRIVVLNYGHKIAEGTPEEIANNEEVISVYLGRKSLNA